MSLLDSIFCVLETFFVIQIFIFVLLGYIHILFELSEHSLTVLLNSLTVTSSRLFPLETIPYGWAVLGRDMLSWFLHMVLVSTPELVP